MAGNAKAVELLIKMKNQTKKDFDSLQKDLNDTIKDLNGIEEKSKKVDKTNSKTFSNMKKGAKTAALSVVGGLTAINGAMLIYVKALTEANRELQNQVRLSGLQSKQFQALSTYLKPFGVNADSAADALNDLNLKVQEAAALGSGAFVDVAKILGLDPKSLAALNDPAKVFDIVISKMKGLNAEQRKLVADELASDYLIHVSEIMNKTGMTIDELTKKFETLGLTVKDTTKESIREFDTSITLLTQKIDAEVKNGFSALYSMLGEELNKAIDNNDLDKISDVLEDLSRGLTATYFNLKMMKNGLMVGLINPIIFLGKTVFNIIDKIIKSTEGMYNILKSFYDGYLSYLKLGFEKLFLFVKDYYNTLIKGFNTVAGVFSDDLKIKEFDTTATEKSIADLTKKVNDSIKEISDNASNLGLGEFSEWFVNDLKDLQKANQEEANAFKQAQKDKIDAIDKLNKKIDENKKKQSEKTTQTTTVAPVFSMAGFDADFKKFTGLFAGAATESAKLKQYNEVINLVSESIKKLQNQIKATSDETQLTQFKKQLEEVQQLAIKFSTDNAKYAGLAFESLVVTNQYFKNNLTSTLQNAINDFENFGDYMKDFFGNLLLNIQANLIQRTVTDPLTNYFEKAIGDGLTKGLESGNSFDFSSIGNNLTDIFSKSLSFLGDGLSKLFNSFVDIITNLLSSDSGSGFLSSAIGAIGSLFGGGGTAVAGGNAVAFAGVAHDGDIASKNMNRTRKVNSSMFNFASKYHTGGIAGLAPNEVPAILEAGEEVLTRDDPRHINNYNNVTYNNSDRTSDKNISINNSLAIGDDDIGKMLTRDRSVDTIINIINKNTDKLKI